MQVQETMEGAKFQTKKRDAGGVPSDVTGKTWGHKRTKETKKKNEKVKKKKNTTNRGKVQKGSVKKSQQFSTKKLYLGGVKACLDLGARYTLREKREKKKRKWVGSQSAPSQIKFPC